MRRIAAAGAAVIVVSSIARQKDGKGRSAYSGLGLASFRGSAEMEFGCDSAYILDTTDDELAVLWVANWGSLLCSLLRRLLHTRPRSPRGGWVDSDLTGLTCGLPTVIIDTMAATSPITDRLRQAILDSGLPLLQIAEATGVERASLSRFVAGKRSLRLDMADKLAAYFRLELVRRAKGKKKG